MTDWTWRHIVITATVVMLFVAASNGVLYWQLSNDFTEKIGLLQNQTEKQFSQVATELESDRTYNDQQRLMLQTALEAQFTTAIDATNKDVADIAEALAITSRSLEERLAQTSSDLEERISSLSANSDFSSIFEEVKPAVLSVRTNLGQGSGFYFDEDGYVITNRHVIEGARAIIVVDHTGASYGATLLGTASTADLAVLEVHGVNNVAHLDFAKETDIRAGQRVIAVGNPLGLSFTVTEGIISATDRIIDNTNIGYVQTDVPINQGNSGGPLVNNNGLVVGVNTLKLGNTEGLGFAIPADITQDIAQQALKYVN